MNNLANCLQALNNHAQVLASLRQAGAPREAIEAIEAGLKFFAFEHAVALKSSEEIIRATNA